MGGQNSAGGAGGTQPVGMIPRSRCPCDVVGRGRRPRGARACVPPRIQQTQKGARVRNRGRGYVGIEVVSVSAAVIGPAGWVNTAPAARGAEGVHGRSLGTNLTE